MKKFSLALVSSAALALAACGGAEEETVEPGEDTAMTAEAPAATGTIVDVAGGNPDFSTLVSAVTAAELGDTLAGEGPYTVFAPTNDAFGKIDEATLNNLLMPEQQEALQGILTYHVVSGEYAAADVISLIEDNGGTATVETVGGGTLTASVVDGNVVLTDATGGTSTVTATDVDASNGVIHVIDTVLMPQ
ncbi:fasciclin domain-containing protein [Sphingomicrobium sediminis]|uniref:Fasciclin domain-containing protein n=1 Tax=Sphingomicrobium sediminis TaxID=2950949 RepID=A0A9X2J2Q3_9SPHN|nr:fasciclin domain-containing protein [Sphingomicrobium sediminis]MCM8558009.1 fasciclin domain-containing protein [Sphingomicrobium sediminis]